LALPVPAAGPTPTPVSPAPATALAPPITCAIILNLLRLINQQLTTSNQQLPHFNISSELVTMFFSA
jgi:hypothetical protein